MTDAIDKDVMVKDLTQMVDEEVRAMGVDITNRINELFGPLFDIMDLGKLSVTIEPTVTVEFE